MPVMPYPRKHISKEQWELAIRLAEEGGSFRTICDRIGINPSVLVYHSELATPEAERFLLARRAGTEILIDDIVDYDYSDPQQAALIKIRSDNHKWRASKMIPSKYGDRIDINIEGGLDLRPVSERAIARLRAIEVVPQLDSGEDTESGDSLFPGETDDIYR